MGADRSAAVTVRLTWPEYPLCARGCAQHFSCTNSFHPHMVPSREGPELFLFDRRQRRSQKSEILGGLRMRLASWSKGKARMDGF